MPPGTIARINPLSYRTTTVYDVAGRSIGSIDPLYNRTTNDAVPVRPILYALLFTGFEKVNLSRIPNVIYSLQTIHVNPNPNCHLAPKTGHIVALKTSHFGRFGIVHLQVPTLEGTTMANQLKMAEIQAATALLQQGWSKPRIARELVLDLETVVRHARRYTCPGSEEV
jgi:hypothetical protein